MRVVGALAFAFALAAVPLYSQEGGKVEDDLDDWFMWLTMGEDYDLVPGSSHYGWLREGQDETFDVYLAQGYDYAVVGACDEDCTDVDLVVNGTSLAGSDRLTDDIPIVRFGVLHSGNFHVRVEMASCSRNPCEYGVEVYRK